MAPYSKHSQPVQTFFPSCPPASADAQKSVVRTPFVSSLHTQPERYAPVGLGAAKVIAGLIHGGPLGALRMALSRS